RGGVGQDRCQGGCGGVGGIGEGVGQGQQAGQVGFGGFHLAVGVGVVGVHFIGQVDRVLGVEFAHTGAGGGLQSQQCAQGRDAARVNLAAGGAQGTHGDLDADIGVVA